MLFRSIYMSGLVPERVTLLQGSWPEEANAAAPLGTPLDVAVDSLGLQLLGLEVGQIMDVYPAASFTDPPSMPVRITGVFERVDPDDEFWFGGRPEGPEGPIKRGQKGPFWDPFGPAGAWTRASSPSW